MTTAHARAVACRGLSMAVETYLDGELEPGQIVEVESHLAECPTCREHVALHRATRTSMRATLRATVSDSFRDRLRARLAEERALAAVPVATPSEQATPIPVAAPPRRTRAAGPLRARYVVPFALAAAAAFAVTVRTRPSEDVGRSANLSSARPTLYNEAGFGIDGILDDMVAQHASPLPSEVSHQEEVRRFDAFVGVPVEPPKLSPFGARWEGARILPLRDSRAAMLQYSMAGGHRVTVYVYDPSRLRGTSRHLTPRVVRSTAVLVGNVRGYNVAATERRGVGYALATDLGEPESVELALAGSPMELRHARVYARAVPDDVDPAELALRATVKKELRKRMRGLRGAMQPSAASERSLRVVAAVEALPAWKTARSVALYWPMIDRREVDVRPLAVAARGAGKVVSYPRVDYDRDEIVLARVDDDATLVAGAMGALGPVDDAPVVAGGAVDLVIVPALAVDLEGRRIGYGRGHYDRLLPAYAPPALAVVVAYEFQLLGELPETAGDVRVGWIVTDERSAAASAPSTEPARVIAPHASEGGVRTIARPQ